MTESSVAAFEVDPSSFETKPQTRAWCASTVGRKGCAFLTLGLSLIALWLILARLKEPPQEKQPGCLSADQRVQTWNCQWCEIALADGLEVWLLHAPSATDLRPHRIVTGDGAFAHVHLACKYTCPEVMGTFKKPETEGNPIFSAEITLAKYKESAGLVQDIPEMLQPLAFGPAVGNRMHTYWAHGIMSPFMQGSLATWMSKRNWGDYKDIENSRNRMECSWFIAKRLAGTVIKLHARSLAHCDIKPENILARKVDQECPELFLSYFEGIKRDPTECVSESLYGKPVGNDTASVIDWKETFITLVEMYFPEMHKEVAQGGLFKGERYDKPGWSAFEKTMHEKAENSFMDIMAESISEFDHDSKHLVLKMRKLLTAVHTASRVDEDDSLSLEAEEAKIVKLISESRDSQAPL